MLRQPARLVVTLILAAALSDPGHDASKVRDILVDPARTSERRLGWTKAPATTSTPSSNGVQTGVRGAQPPSGIVPVREAARSGHDPLKALPESLRKLAEQMGGVPAWYVGPSIGPMIDIPGEDN